MIIRPAFKTDLTTLLEFEQEIIRAERPFNDTLKDGEIHLYCKLPYTSARVV